MPRANDSAFPAPTMTTQQGLSKREWVAAQVLAGLAAGGHISDVSLRQTADQMARRAVVLADALLARLLTGGSEPFAIHDDDEFSSADDRAALP